MTSEFNIRHPLDPDISSLAEEWHRNPLAALLRADANRDAALAIADDNRRKAATKEPKS